jgi:hypothetical protein
MKVEDDGALPLVNVHQRFEHPHDYPRSGAQAPSKPIDRQPLSQGQTYNSFDLPQTGTEYHDPPKNRRLRTKRKRQDHNGPNSQRGSDDLRNSDLPSPISVHGPPTGGCWI